MTYYKRGERVLCPHCETAVLLEAGNIADGNAQDEDGVFSLCSSVCPSCSRAVVCRINLALDGHNYVRKEQYLLWPRSKPPRFVSKAVPEHIAADYNEASLVLSLSPKASAALSRRCLQAVLRKAGGANQRDLMKQIEAVMSTLPTYVAQNVDAIRNIGNFAAHPSKDTSTGEIVEVEMGEAEWNLDVLDELFDFYYVQPAIAQVKRDELNAKLVAAGKPPMM